MTEWVWILLLLLAALGPVGTFLWVSAWTVAEELVFRGLLQWLLTRWLRSPATAVALQAALFSLAHGLDQSPPLALGRFALGLALGWAVVRTHALWAGIAFHLAHNALALGLASGDGPGDPADAPWSALAVSAGEAAVFVALVWFGTRLVSHRKGVANRSSSD